MRNEKSQMRNKKKVIGKLKYYMIFLVVLVCMILITNCKDYLAIEDGYGRISINIVDGEVEPQQARTIFPSMDFGKYEYIFKKAGETTGDKIIPNNEGFFTLEIGDYTVEVLAYTGDEEPYFLAASGESSEFTVGHGYNDPVGVFLSLVDGAVQGEFKYTITYPVGAEVEITLQRWPTLEDIVLNPVNISQGNGKTQTLKLDVGSYLLTVLINKNELYAGISEAVHIAQSLKTTFTKDFDDYDLITTTCTHEMEWVISQDVVVFACIKDGCTHIEELSILDDSYFELIAPDNNAYRIVRGSVVPPNVVYIPSSYNSLPVIEIGRADDESYNSTFSYRSNITAVYIPDTITDINNYAFLSCSNIAKIVVPESVIKIGRVTFGGWNNSQSIYVQNHLSQTSADIAWGSDWRIGCNAQIIYGEGRYGTDPLPGSMSSPFQINNAVELSYVSKGNENPDGYKNWTNFAHYVLMTDINLNNQEWSPISFSSILEYGFSGTFDGNGKTITGLYINKPSITINNLNLYPYGLFGLIYEGTVKNIAISGSITVGGYYDGVGGVVGKNLYGTVQNCPFDGIVTSNGLAGGGVVGKNLYGTVQNCSFDGIVTSNSSIVGGVVGENGTSGSSRAIVQNCYSTGSVSGREKVGGVVGEHRGIVQYCYSFSNVNGIIAVGGVVGWNSYSTVQNCYSTGNVNATGDDSGLSVVGGVVGHNDGSAIVQNCYSTGNITGNSSVGGVTGWISGTVQNCYSTGNVTGKSGVGGVAGLNQGTVQNSYSTGNISGSGSGVFAGFDMFGDGGLVGHGYNGIVQNCVALNKSINRSSGSGIRFGRIVGSQLTTIPGIIVIILTNNYGRSDMTLPVTVTSDVNDIHGLDITSIQWNDASWWQNTVQLPSGAWEFRAGLPVLKDMPTGTQNPMVQ